MSERILYALRRSDGLYRSRHNSDEFVDFSDAQLWDNDKKAAKEVDRWAKQQKHLGWHEERDELGRRISLGYVDDPVNCELVTIRIEEPS